ncbi:MAG: family 2 glycosyl transferase, partial [Bacteroidota bacterium]|nr:family 2 glycosyl transferase [Bacteroidota bacterium]
LAGFYSQHSPAMIVAPVMFHQDHTILEKLQSLEMMALMASTGGALFHNKAIMCNGANLAYKKDVFLEVKGFDNIRNSPSGDDVLLMYKIGKIYPKSIRYLKNREAIVYTKARNSFRSFISQRVRWASKEMSVNNRETIFVSLLVYVFSFLLLFMPLAGYFCLSGSPVRPLFFDICLILGGFKCFIDFLLLFLAASFYNRKTLLLYFLPAQLIYMLYVVIVGLLGKQGKYEWKNRKYN